MDMKHRSKIQVTPKLFNEIKSLAEQYKLNISCSNQENFIREFQDKVDWDEISCNQELSEDFIREFQDKVDWIEISYNQKLSENFIREFQDKVDWYIIYQCQKLSNNFIKEFKLNLIFASNK